MGQGQRHWGSPQSHTCESRCEEQAGVNAPMRRPAGEVLARGKTSHRRYASCRMSGMEGMCVMALMRISFSGNMSSSALTSPPLDGTLRRFTSFSYTKSKVNRKSK